MELSNDSEIYESRNISKNEEEKYKKIKVLGEGSMGKVYLVESREQNGKLYVMKRINIGHLEPKEKQQALLEAQLHNMVSHENIIAFKEIYHTTKDKLCIIMEYADGGDLDELLRDLKDSKKMLTEEQILKYFTQICLGLREIHDKKIVHRDLKGANIFLLKDGNVKLGDFGISKAMDKTVLASKSFVGTPFYLSPQMVEGKPYSTKADIWALGIILYHMCALKLPFDANSLPVLALKIIKGSYPHITGNQYSKDLKSLIASMLQVDQRKRPSVNEILSKPIISKNLPRELVQMITPKMKPKVEIRANKVKLETTKSRKQLLLENYKSLTQEEKDKNKEQIRLKREEERQKREEERRKMHEDLKAKRLQNAKENSGSSTAVITKKQPPLAKNHHSSSKKVIEAPKVEAKSIAVEKPWKNKNFKKQNKQIEVQIILPGQRKKPEPEKKIEINEPIDKKHDFEVQIFVNGQKPYRMGNKNSRPSPKESAQQEIKAAQTAPQFYTDQNELQDSQYITEEIQQSSYQNGKAERQHPNVGKGKQPDNNLQDMLANVQLANKLVGNLSNPYQKNDIELYEESESFDSTLVDNYNKERSEAISKKQVLQNSQTDAENMKYITGITDGQNLEELRTILEDRLGEEGFIQALGIVRNHLEQYSQSLSSKEEQSPASTKYQEEEAKMFNRQLLREKLSFLSKEQFDRNIELLYTISIMEDMEMMRNFDSCGDQSEEFCESSGRSDTSID